MEQAFVQSIQAALDTPDKVHWKAHALLRMRQRGIRVDNIIDALRTGSVIEEYRTDAPFPSALISGHTAAGRPLHVVVGVNAPAGEVHIITGYEPDPLRWNEDFSKRR